MSKLPNSFDFLFKISVMYNSVGHQTTTKTIWNKSIKFSLVRQIAQIFVAFSEKLNFIWTHFRRFMLKWKTFWNLATFRNDNFWCEVRNGQCKRCTKSQWLVNHAENYVKLICSRKSVKILQRKSEIYLHICKGSWTADLFSTVAGSTSEFSFYTIFVRPYANA